LLQESVVRDYLKESGNPEEKRQAIACDTGTISRFARRRVSFADRGKRLEQVFDLLFGISPWLNGEAEVLIRDLVGARNVIVHAGGWPDASHAADVETPGLIVESNKFFHKLVLAPFIQPMISAAGGLAVYVDEKLKVDPRYELRKS
jgi:hypothetical protein